MKFKNIILYGGTSQISVNLIKLYINETEKIIIFCRSINKFKEMYSDYEDHINKIQIFEVNLEDLEKNLEIINKFNEDISGVFWISGFTGNAEIEYQDIAKAKNNLNINLIHPIIIINEISKKIIKNKNSFIVGLSSVAGIKGRKKQLFYSPAKSGLISYLSGLRQKLHEHKIHVMTVIPGYINTEPFKKMNINAPKFLVTEPDKAALIIRKSLIKKKEIIYINFLWNFIMKIINVMPEKIFKRFSF